MDFEYTSEQQMLRDSVRRLYADHYGPAGRARYRDSDTGYSEAVWEHLAQMGLLGLGGEGSAGGQDDVVHLALAMEALGRAAALEPLLPTAVHGAALVQLAGSSAQRERWLAPLAAGRLQLAVADAEPQARYELADVRTTATREGAGWRLDGRKRGVCNGGHADWLLVVARVEGGARERHGLGLFAVDRKAAGLSVDGFRRYDGRRAADLQLNAVRVEDTEMLGTPGEALPLLERARELAIAAQAAEAVGCMDALMELTVNYLKTREQFGQPIGRFQALQHRAVDMLTAVEQARSMALYAQMMAADPDPAARARALSATQVQIARSARLVGQGAIQLHGGMGMTAEYPAGDYFKRLTAIETDFGDAEHHLRRLAELGGVFPAAA
jgi:alkylation response protein AidB-like acyl-CoA dehydrogenase